MRRKLLCAVLMLAALPAQAAIEVDTVRLGHGVKAWYASSDTVPVVDIQISFEGAGYASDPAGKEGRAALAASMLTEGAGTLDALAFQQALEDGAIQLEVNASADRLIVHLHCLREQAVRGGELLAMALSQPQFAPTDLSRVKAQFTTMLQQLDERAGYRAGRLLSAHVFAQHPYANPPYGTNDSIAQLTAEDLRHYIGTYATRSNVLITAAGDVDGSLLDEVLAPLMTVLPDNAVETHIVPAKFDGAGQQFDETMPVPQTVVQFAAPGLPRDDERFYALTMLNYALGGDGLIGRLAKGVRQDKGLVYSIGTDLDVRRGAALIGGSLATRNASKDEAIAAVKAVLTDLQTRGLTHQECEDARTYVLGSQALRLDGSEAVAGMLLSMRIFGLGEDYLSKRAGYFNAVDCNALNTLASELLDPSRFVFATVGGPAAK